MFTVFIVVQILLTLALVGLILVQRNDSDGLGSMGGGGGGGNALMTGRGAANLMTRSTAIIATLFMLNSLWLAYQAAAMSDERSLSQKIETVNEETTSVPLADDETTPVTTPKPLTPEMGVITTEEPSGEPVTAEPKEEAVDGMDMTAPEAEEESAPMSVPTP